MQRTVLGVSPWSHELGIVMCQRLIPCRLPYVNANPVVALWQLCVESFRARYFELTVCIRMKFVRWSL